MATLSPKLASELALGVYAIRKSGNIRRASIGSISKHISLQERLVGKTGGYIFNKQTVFAILGLGKGVYSGGAVIAIRGTAMTSGHDWSTNAQIGLRGTENDHISLCRL